MILFKTDTNHRLSIICVFIYFCRKKVVKEISTPNQSPEDTIDDQREASILRKLDHPAIIKFYDSFPNTDSFCIVSEYAEVKHD